MQMPFGFAPMPIIHNFQGRHPGPFLRSSRPNAERASRCTLHPALRACLLGHSPPACSVLGACPGGSSEEGVTNRPQMTCACRDSKQCTAGGRPCPGGTLQLQNPVVRWLHPVPEPEPHVCPDFTAPSLTPSRRHVAHSILIVAFAPSLIEAMDACVFTQQPLHTSLHCW